MTLKKTFKKKYCEFSGVTNTRVDPKLLKQKSGPGELLPVTTAATFVTVNSAEILA